MKTKITIVLFAGVLLLVGSIHAQLVVTQTTRFGVVAGESNPKKNRSQGLDMLKDIKNEIKEFYFDKNFKGVDLNAEYEAAKKRIEDSEHNWQIFSIIAEFVLKLDDSHTNFYPPNYAKRVDYGFRIQMIGQTAVVTYVRPTSDAETKGLKAGDVLLSIDGYQLNRNNLWVVNYIIGVLDPREMLTVTVADGEDKQKELKVESRFLDIKERQKMSKKSRKLVPKDDRKVFKCHEVNSDTIICRLETFVVSRSTIDKLMSEVKDHKNFILDLRGNGGGYVDTNSYFLGYFFEDTIHVNDFVSRKKKEVMKAESKGSKVFKGDMIVLVDSRSASASEIFSRVMQIEKRAIVIGDQTAGAVMTSISRPMIRSKGLDAFESVVVYNLSVTVGDVVMSDGGRLEKSGVIPDIMIGPAPQSFVEISDPVLAYAVQRFGGDMDQHQAGALRFLIPKAIEDYEMEADDQLDEEEN
ncbi:MAG: S41 family peptidase [Pyrinomonadaceae bacterium]